MKLWERAKGHWSAILAAANIDPNVLDGKHHPCPACGGKDRFRYTRDEDGGFFCGDTRGNGIELLKHLCGVDFKGAARIIEGVIGKSNEPREYTGKTWAQELRSSAVHSKRSAYLASRGLEVPPGVQFGRRIEYREDDKVLGRYDAMLAPVTRAGKFLTYHVTYLDHGRKADVPTVRKLLPGPANRGASIALYPAAATMGVAEGIETAIAAKMLHGMPVWSALNTSLLKAWEPPPIARHVYIFGDCDPHYAGHAAAWALAHRLALKGLKVEVCIPDAGDWNDVLLRHQVAA